MGYFSKFLGLAAAVMLLSATMVGAEEKDPLKPRVPPDQLADAKALKNPIANTPENVAKGKALFEGKGTCFNCHGKEGKGDGPAGAILNPSPRNFTNCKFHKKRKRRIQLVRPKFAGEDHKVAPPAARSPRA